MKICFVLGTRPEIIKLFPLIKLCKINKIKHFIIHTGQHFDYNMEGQFLKDLDIKPNYFLNLNNKKNYKKNFFKRAEKKLINCYIKIKPDYIINQGDTNTVLASALAYKKIKKKLNAKLVHIEAGIRSFDKKMPEEINRIRADKISDVLFAPTNIAKKNIINEKLKGKKIYVVGNTISDTIRENSKLWKNKKKFKEEYFFLTLHRPETVDKIKRLKVVFNTLIEISKDLNIKIIFPIHPRTKKKIKILKIQNLGQIKIIKPCNYFESLNFQKNAKLIITDSGGMQEESCILKKPCVTIRNNTERPETLRINSNILTGYKSFKIKIGINKMLKIKRNWKSPYGSFVSKKIIKILKNNYKNEK